MIKVNITYLLIVITWYTLYIIFMGFLYLKYSRPYKVKKVVQYYKKIPEKLSPIELSLLMYHKVSASALSATIAELIDKGLIIRDGKLLKRVEVEQLVTASEDSAIELLFDVLGDGKKVDVTKISNFCHNNSASTDFLLAYDVWNNLAIREANKKQFFVPKMDYELVRWFQIIGYVLVVLNFVFNLHNIIGYFIVIPAYFILQFFYKTYKRTAKYNEQFYEWLAFRNYLDTIDSKEEADLGHIAIIYSIVLNKSSHIEQVFNGEQYLTDLNDALQKCYKRAFLFGNRKI